MTATINKKDIELLKKIIEDKEFYPPVGECDESQRLRKLAKEGYIRWCPYPEEFYIVTPSGLEMFKA